MTVPTLEEVLRPELSKFDHTLAMKLRKRWKEGGCQKDPEQHKKFCKKAGAHYGVHPKTIRWIVMSKRWSDLKPAQHVKAMPAGLGLVKSKAKAASGEINIHELVKNGEIKINAKLWRDLNEHFDKGTIKEAIIKAIRHYEMPAPMQPISLREADAAFKQIQEFDVSKLIKRMPTVTRWDYRYAISDIVIDAPRTGNEASNYYHQENRWKCDYKGIPSPYRVWHGDKYMMSMLNALWTLKYKVIGNPEFRTTLSMRKYIASQFKPLAARCFYELFNAKRVYDPSSGWGDRVAGFMATKGAEFYCSTDPNSSLYEGYAAEVKRYRQKGQEIEMHCHGSELPKGMRKRYGYKVDTVFTSPPYFNAEQYSDDPGQSFRKFGEIDAWLEGFLFPSLKNSWDALTDEGDRGGILAMNIADIYNNDTMERGEICDPMNDYIGTLKGARYLGCIGLRLAKRPQSGALEGKEGASIEPIWLWAKGGTWTLEDYLKHGFANCKRKPSKGLGLLKGK